MELLSPTVVWKNALESLKDVIDSDSFDIFEYTELVSISKKEAVLRVPSQFFSDMIREKYHSLISNCLGKEIDSPGIRVLFTVGKIESTKEDIEDEKRSFNESEKKRGGLNPNYNFSSFVVGTGNQFAYAAALKVAESPGQDYNPLFIYGDVGLGKTHLLHAIGNYLKEKKPNLPMVYVTCEQFTNDVVNSIRYKKMAELRYRYRNIQMLLIDDIQFIAGKVATQEEFFHTFNALYEQNRQIVFSSDRPAKEMSDVEERLWSRFKMGLMADIQSPNLETRIAILYKKAEVECITLSEEVALFLAQNVRSNVREMEGALIRLGAHSSLMGQPITLDLAKHILRDIIVIKKREISIEEIQKAVCDHLQMKASDLKSPRRTKNLVFARQIAMYLCREFTEASFPEIGEAFGGKDHSTVIHSCKQVEKEKDKNVHLKTVTESLVKKLSGE
jgi:chromosomal replication initiator protein